MTVLNLAVVDLVEDKESSSYLYSLLKYLLLYLSWILDKPNLLRFEVDFSITLKKEFKYKFRLVKMSFLWINL